MASTDSRWIKLNVAGKPLLTKLTTLLSCPDSLLAKMFDPNSDQEQAHKENGIYFLDTNPKYFGIILDWLRHKQIITEKETDLNNVAKIADYFGLDDLVEAIKKSQKPKETEGKWVEYSNLSNHYDVPAMKMEIEYTSWLTVYTKSFRIAKFSNGLGVVMENKGGECLVLDEKRPLLWVPTVVGKVPYGAISVDGLGSEKMYIGRKIFSSEGPLNEEMLVRSCGENLVVPQEIEKKYKKEFAKTYTKTNSVHISVGYVNEEGTFGITFTESFHSIVTGEEGRASVRGLTFEKHNCSATEFEILCVF